MLGLGRPAGSLWENPRMPLRYLIAFLVGYVFLDWVSYIHPLQQSSITPWNPQPALAVAVLALCGQRYLWAVLGAIVAAEVFVRGAPSGPMTTMLVAAVLTLGYGAMAVALKGNGHVNRMLDTRRGLTRFVGVVAVGSLVTGTLYTGAMWAAGAELPGRYVEVLTRFWIGDCVGILVTLPPVLILSDPERRAVLAAMFRQPLFYLQIGSVKLALGIAFVFDFAEPLRLFYVLFLPLIWIAMTSGVAGASLATILIQGGLIWAAHFGQYPELTVFQIQALLITLSVTGLFLGGTVDERLRAGRELQQSLRLAAAGEMSAALAHELNQPLTALATYTRAASLLSQAPEINRDQLADTLNKILAESNRAADVVRRLRDFFRTGSTDLKPASLAQIAHSTMASLGPRAQDLNVSLEERVFNPLPDVLVDSIQIEVVLRNLVANGIDAAAAGAAPRQVVLEVGPGEAGYLQAVVRDSGAGVMPAHREDVFEPFWSTRATGMGMGLAISRAIVEAHGGRIWVETKGKGVFGFSLPVPHA
jgi:two-component system sensor kinase FixL